MRACEIQQVPEVSYRSFPEKRGEDEEVVAYYDKKDVEPRSADHPASNTHRSISGTCLGHGAGPMVVYKHFAGSTRSLKFRRCLIVLYGGDPMSMRHQCIAALVRELDLLNTLHLHPRSVKSPASGDPSGEGDFSLATFRHSWGVALPWWYLGRPVPAQMKYEAPPRRAANLLPSSPLFSLTILRVPGLSLTVGATPSESTETVRYLSGVYYDKLQLGRSQQKKIPEARYIEAGYSMDPARTMPREGEASTS